MAATRNSRPSDPVSAVAAALAPRLTEGTRVCIALSGGRDSVALLHALVDLRSKQWPRLRLSALHVHHGLSPQADAWAAFCAQLCLEHTIPLRCERVTVARDAPAGLEAAARQARYAAFVACDTDWLLLAHHRDDQAETLLLNLLRGAGAHGLSAMPEDRPLATRGPRLLRPLLHTSRAAIDDWLAVRGARWIEDESNDETALRRNFLRHEVLPVIGQQVADPGRMLARAAGHLAEMASLADEVAASDADGVVDGRSLCLAAFGRLSPQRRSNLLRHFLRLHGLRMPDARYLAEILRQLREASLLAMPDFAIDDWRLQVTRGRLWLVPRSAASVDRRWCGQSELPWSGGCVRFTTTVGEGLSQRALRGMAVLRHRQGGETLRPDMKRPRRTLKKLLQEAGVPQWKRDAMPLFWCDGRLVWAADIGYACDEGMLAAAGEPGWLLSWQPAPSNSAG